MRSKNLEYIYIYVYVSREGIGEAMGYATRGIDTGKDRWKERHNLRALHV